MLSQKSYAATGTITNSNAYAWGENIGWINFKANGGNVTVTDTKITGFAWSPNYGWINLSPTNGGVTNTTSGQLGGYAWSSSLGWINFSGANIDANGEFTGTIGTQGSTVGRINFSCASCTVVTDWQPETTPTPTSQSSTSRNGGSDNGNDSSTDNPPNNTTTNNGDVSSNGGNNTNINDTVENQETHQEIVTELLSYFNGLTEGERTELVKILERGNTSNLTDEQTRIMTLFNQLSEREKQKILDSIKNNKKQLLDIRLSLDSALLDAGNKLIARVTFENFGTEKTPVTMMFIILDDQGKEYFRTKKQKTIQTETTFTQKFPSLQLPDGKYQLILQTNYNKTVNDQFTKTFEVSSSPTKIVTNTIIPILLALIMLFLVIYALKKKKRKSS